MKEESTGVVIRHTPKFKPNISKIPDNVVLVGKKEPIHYSSYAISRMNTGSKTIIFKACGSAVVTAIDSIIKLGDMLNINIDIIDLKFYRIQNEVLNSKVAVEIVIKNPLLQEQGSV